MYGFYAPSIQNLLPFTKEELNDFKARKMKIVTDHSPEYETKYYFNESGQLYFEKSFSIKKSKGKIQKSVLDSVFYKYDVNGKLIVVKSSMHAGSYDSVAYDKAGRMTYLLSFDIYKEKRNKLFKDINYELVLERSDANTSTFINKADTFSNTRYVYDANNNIKKQYTENSTDSLARNDIADGEYSIRYYYKQDTGKYRMGQEEFYKNNRLSVCTHYDMYYPNSGPMAYKTERYFYNEKGLLFYKTTGDYYGEIEMYFYNNANLVSQKYTMYRERLESYSEYYYTAYE